MASKSAAGRPAAGSSPCRPLTVTPRERRLLSSAPSAARRRSTDQSQGSVAAMRTALLVALAAALVAVGQAGGPSAARPRQAGQPQSSPTEVCGSMRGTLGSWRGHTVVPAMCTAATALFRGRSGSAWGMRVLGRKPSPLPFLRLLSRLSCLPGHFEPPWSRLPATLPHVVRVAAAQLHTCTHTPLQAPPEPRCCRSSSSSTRASTRPPRSPR